MGRTSDPPGDARVRGYLPKSALALGLERNARSRLPGNAVSLRPSLAGSLPLPLASLVLFPLSSGPWCLPVPLPGTLLPVSSPAGFLHTLHTRHLCRNVPPASQAGQRPLAACGAGRPRHSTTAQHAVPVTFPLLPRPLHTCMHTRTCTCTHSHVHIYTHTHTQRTYVYVRTRTPTRRSPMEPQQLTFGPGPRWLWPFTEQV